MAFSLRVASVRLTISRKIEKFRLKQSMEARLDAVWDREKSGIVLKR